MEYIEALWIEIYKNEQDLKRKIKLLGREDRPLEKVTIDEALNQTIGPDNSDLVGIVKMAVIEDDVGNVVYIDTNSAIKIIAFLREFFGLK